MFTVYALIVPAIAIDRNSKSSVQGLYTDEDGGSAPVCGLEEHTHTEACYEDVVTSTEKILICGHEEGEIISPEVYSEDAASGETGLQESGGETGVDGTADGQSEKDAEPAAVLQEEVVHHHEESCWRTVEKTERRLVCGKQEHVHTAYCYEEPGRSSENDSEKGGAAFVREVGVEGASYKLKISVEENCGIPETAQFLATAISDHHEEYGTFKDKAFESVDEEKSGESHTNEMYGLFDLTIRAEDGSIIEPAAPVKVEVDFGEEIVKEKGADSDQRALYAVHFPGVSVQEEPSGEQSVIIDPEKAEKDISGTDVEVIPAEEKEKGVVSFEAESFSVYAIVYTVDFHWEIDGKEYKFCITGGTGVSLKEVLSQIHVVKGDDDTGETATDLSADAFINKITEVTFSDPDLLYVYKVEQEITTLGIKQETGLNPEYSALMTRQEIDEADEKVYTAPDWALLPLKPFFTEEGLKITMEDGEIFSILVTDAQSDAFHNTDGTVQTIANPAGTTFDVFDYWISDNLRNSTARAAWPGTVGQVGTGNNSGINASPGDATNGHALKFTPANDKSVYDGTLDNWQRAAVDGGDGLNSWTKNANPRQGIVAGTLVDGYPKLSGNGNLGATNEPWPTCLILRITPAKRRLPKQTISFM